MEEDDYDKFRLERVKALIFTEHGVKCHQPPTDNACISGDKEVWEVTTNLSAGNASLIIMVLVNTKHLYNICVMLDQRRRRCAYVVQMFCVYWVIYTVWRNSVFGLK